MPISSEQLLRLSGIESCFVSALNLASVFSASPNHNAKIMGSFPIQEVVGIRDYAKKFRDLMLLSLNRH